MKERRVAKPKHNRPGQHDREILRGRLNGVHAGPADLAGAHRHAPQPAEHDLRRPCPDTRLQIAGSQVHDPASGSGDGLCQENNLLPLTVLVVNRETGKPGVGLSTLEDIDKNLERVFNHDWFHIYPPTSEEFEEAHRKRLEQTNSHHKSPGPTGATHTPPLVDPVGHDQAPPPRKRGPEGRSLRQGRDPGVDHPAPRRQPLGPGWDQPPDQVSGLTPVPVDDRQDLLRGYRRMWSSWRGMKPAITLISVRNHSRRLACGPPNSARFDARG